MDANKKAKVALAGLFANKIIEPSPHGYHFTIEGWEIVKHKWENLPDEDKLIFGLYAKECLEPNTEVVD